MIKEENYIKCISDFYYNDYCGRKYAVFLKGKKYRAVFNNEIGLASIFFDKSDSFKTELREIVDGNCKYFSLGRFIIIEKSLKIDYMNPILKGVVESRNMAVIGNHFYKEDKL